MKIRLTKRFIADVLRKEPLNNLTAGTFLAEEPIINSQDCYSCAVGTVIRRSLSSRVKGERVWDSVITPMCGWNWVHGDALEAVETDPMRALSIAYETACGSMGGRRHFSLARGRRDAIRFVEKHFPSHVEIDIDGLKPVKARGVTVVGARRR